MRRRGDACPVHGPLLSKSPQCLTTSLASMVDPDPGLVMARREAESSFDFEQQPVHLNRMTTLKHESVTIERFCQRMLFFTLVKSGPIDAAIPAAAPCVQDGGMLCIAPRRVADYNRKKHTTESLFCSQHPC